jgi:hypothetical protein
VLGSRGLGDVYMIQVINTPRFGNAATFAKQIEILLGQSEAAVVYFAEDDYLYKPDEFRKMYDLITTQPGVDFVSCYCHSDLFTHPIHQHRRRTMFVNNRLWLGASSTCLTFMTTQRVLRETRDLFMTFCAGSWDSSVWLGITRTHVLNPAAYFRFRRDAYCMKILRKAIGHGWRHLPFLRRYALFVPFPGIGTHLEAQFVSPETDWLQVAAGVEGRAS